MVDLLILEMEIYCIIMVGMWMDSAGEDRNFIWFPCVGGDGY